MRDKGFNINVMSCIITGFAMVDKGEEEFDDVENYNPIISTITI